VTCARVAVRGACAVGGAVARSTRTRASRLWPTHCLLLGLYACGGLPLGLLACMLASPVHNCNHDTHPQSLRDERHHSSPHLLKTSPSCPEGAPPHHPNEPFAQTGLYLNPHTTYRTTYTSLFLAHLPPPQRDRWESLQVTVLHNLLNTPTEREWYPLTQEDNEKFI
jgi:hypothetical protein